MKQLNVWFEGRPVGVLEEVSRRNLRLRYHEDWMASPHATPLSVSLPLAAGSHRGRGVAAYLWGLLPDNNRVDLRWRVF